MKFVREHCSICKVELKMPVVQEDDGKSKLIWVQCPQCKEIKPIEIGSRSPEDAADPSEAGGPAEDGGHQPETTPRKVVRHYRLGERFVRGEWIYHAGWDDTGQIVDKSVSKGGKDVIVVSFQRVGTKRLVTNFLK